MPTPRDRRLLMELQRLRLLSTPESLIRIYCATLSEDEGKEFLRQSMSFKTIQEGLAGFLTPEQFESQYPGIPPEKYLILFSCRGLCRKENGDIVPWDQHGMEVIFGWDYPAKPPTFVWHTPIWHPNFKTPYICVHGRRFAVGMMLDEIVLEVGRMIQYQNYNLQDPLNSEAAEWARQNLNRFPVDDRDLLNYRIRSRAALQKETPLVEMIGPGQVELSDPLALIELTCADSGAEAGD